MEPNRRQAPKNQNILLSLICCLTFDLVILSRSFSKEALMNVYKDIKTFITLFILANNQK